MRETMSDLTVIGGGLAGSEAAWQAAEAGLSVALMEMRPQLSTEAHQTDLLAELVCSNSLGSTLEDRASGLLNKELHRFGSLLLQCAEEAALPAGTALAVDRERFSQLVTERVLQHPRIELIRAEARSIPDGLCIVASGPLTSPALAQSIAEVCGRDNLFFYDAIAPIVFRESIDMGIAFRASRYEQDPVDGGDYINCPLDKTQYHDFVSRLRQAERIPMRAFEQDIPSGVNAGRFFEGCLPVEILADRGDESLAFGPMRPVGLIDPRSGHRPYAVVQLRQDNLGDTLYNMVGFQTNLRYPEQKAVFGLIPGLERAEFARYGQMHRNTFIASPELLLPSLQFRARPDLLFAGQIMGVEGYLGNIATGLLAGVNAARIQRGQAAVTLPETTMMGALCHYATHAPLKDYQPMKANFGILPPLTVDGRLGKRERAHLYAARALSDLDRALAAN